MSLTMRGIVALFLGVMAIAILEPPGVEAQISLDLVACRKIEPGTQAFFFDLRYSQCGNRFTSKDPYVGLVAHLRNVDEHTRVTVEVFDPGQASVWKRDQTFAPTAGSYYPNLWVWVVLPVAAGIDGLATENVRLTASVIRLTDKPAPERLGEWTLRAQADRAGPRTLKFTLQAAP